MGNAWLMGCSALAATVAGAGAWLGVRRGGYRDDQDQPRRRLEQSWLLIPAAGIGGTVAGLHGWSWLFVGAWVFVVAGAVLAWVDLDVHRIPRRMVAPLGWVLLLVVVAAAATGGGWILLLRAAAGAGVMGGVFLVLALAGSMGLGDVRLATITGLLMGAYGWTSVAVAVLVGFGVAAMAAVGLLVSGVHRSAHVAFGPAIILGAAIAIAW